MTEPWFLDNLNVLYRHGQNFDSTDFNKTILSNIKLYILYYEHEKLQKITFKMSLKLYQYYKIPLETFISPEIMTQVYDHLETNFITE